MGRALWLVGVTGMCLGLVGCGSDTRDALVQRTVKQLTEAASNMSSIRTAVEKWEKEPKEKAKYLKTAGEAADRLKKNGQVLQEVKQLAESLDALTQEQKDEQHKNVGKNLQSALNGVVKEMNALNATMARAEKIDKAGLSDLTKKLREAQSDFEVSTRSR